MMKWGWHVGIFLGLTLIVSAVSYFDAKGIRTLLTLYKENKNLNSEITKLQADHQRLKQQITQIKDNPEVQERIVRLETGYLAEDEMLLEWRSDK